MNFKDMPLDLKLLLYIVTGIILVMTFTMFLIISTTTEQHEELVYKEAVSLTENYATHFDSDMRANMAIARGIASTMKVYRTGDR